MFFHYTLIENKFHQVFGKVVIIVRYIIILHYTIQIKSEYLLIYIRFHTIIVLFVFQVISVNPESSLNIHIMNYYYIVF